MEKKIDKKWRPIANVYDPFICGSIDATDTIVHDKAIIRASVSSYKPDKSIKGNPKNTLFVGRLSLKTEESTLGDLFCRYGKIKKLKIVRDLVTGYSKRYAFIEFEDFIDAKKAFKDAHNRIVDESSIIVDWEHSRALPGWIPRRFGGGFGGKRESGQLRFGCRDKPFIKPLNFVKDKSSC